MEETEVIHSSNAVINDLAEFLEANVFIKIINKLTDYAEIITEGKLGGIINFNYKLNRTQTLTIIELLLDMQALSRIYAIAMKGSRDLESEYVSNIFSDTTNPEGISSYMSLRNLLENRLSHQTQQYNMNMGKNNTTLAMPLNELRGHVKTFTDLTSNKITISSKVQHGMIAASLHDAYVVLTNRPEFWNDKTYMKFFFNEDEPMRREQTIVTRETRLSLLNINKNIEEFKDKFTRMVTGKLEIERQAAKELRTPPQTEARPSLELDTRSRTFIDKMLMTPFGKQYGSKIDAILEEIFPQKAGDTGAVSEDVIRDKLAPLFELFRNSSPIEDHKREIVEIVDFLIKEDYSIKTMAEKFLHVNKKESFNKFFSDSNRALIEIFMTHLFTMYYEEQFSPIFRIIKSLDMKKFASAYIIKRIYLTRGENLTNFGFFFIRTIAKLGGIKIQ